MQRQNASSEPTPSTPEIDLGPLQDALNQAEIAVQACGPNLQLRVTSSGDVELVRRSGEASGAVPGTALAGSGEVPGTALARLAGCDPLLWSADAGASSPAVTLGPPYGDGEARCALSGRVIVERAPVELYHYGRPVGADRALALAPLLVRVRQAVMAAGSVVEELGGWSSVENRELRGVLMERGLREVVGRWVG